MRFKQQKVFINIVSIIEKAINLLIYFIFGYLRNPIFQIFIKNKYKQWNSSQITTPACVYGLPMHSKLYQVNSEVGFQETKDVAPQNHQILQQFHQERETGGGCFGALPKKNQS